MERNDADLQEFGKWIGSAIRSLGLAIELIEAEYAQGLKPMAKKNISEARRLAGQKGKETRKARAAAGGRY